jgi:hypothetical protein
LPKRKFGQGNGWLRRDRRYHGQSTRDLIDNHYWRGFDGEGGGERRRKEVRAHGRTAAETQGKDGHFTTCNEFPNMEIDDRGRSDLGGSNFNAGEFEDQNISSNGEEIMVGVQ